MKFLILFLISKIVIYGKYDGIIHPPSQEYIISLINEGEKKGAEIVILMLDTPGGLDPSMREIIKKIMNSSVPVCVFVYPQGARAASAGAFITISAHIAAMAPSTNIGAAHPVTIGEGQKDTIMMKKVLNDAVAYMESIAKKRKRNVQVAKQLVEKSLSISAEEALNKKIIDLIANDLNDLLSKIDGKIVEVSGIEKKIETKDAELLEYKMNLRNKILSVISNPTIAYILLILGFYGLFFEITHPGAIFPGVIGAICLILALYALQTLPVNYAGVLLILLSMILFLLEVKIQSHGALGLGGVISLLLGSLLLFSRDIPYLQISLWAIAGVIVVTSIFFLIVITKVIQVHKRKPVSGKEGIIGEKGIAKSDIDKNGGIVFVHGEIWKAISNEKIKKGEEIIVKKIDGLKLIVEKIKGYGN
jgi:membrane-bound serine protease (ClpP class)